MAALLLAVALLVLLDLLALRFAVDSRPGVADEVERWLGSPHEERPAGRTRILD